MSDQPEDHPRTGTDAATGGVSRRRLLQTSLAVGAAASAAGATGVGAPPAAAEAAAGPLDITDRERVVGINYSVWFDPVRGAGDPVYNIAEILADAAADGQEPDWGPEGAFHYWDRPAPGYYRSDDAAVHRLHFQQLSDARVDFLSLDATNAAGPQNQDPAYFDELYLDPTRSLFESALAERAAGRPTPWMVPWVRSQAADADPAYTGRRTYQELVADGRYADLLVQWDGKPLLLVTDTVPAELEQWFTVRKMWGLQQQLADQEWSFLQPYPQNVGYAADGTPEQLSVSAALQRTYMTEPTAITRRGGRTFAQQWRRAFEVVPKVTVVTWWNEWIAQRFVDEEGDARFVDNYTREASRDLEPMTGGHGDLYYRWLQTYVAAFKDGAAFPEGLLEGPGLRRSGRAGS